MPDLDIIEINDQLAHDAKLLASGMSEPQIRKRGMIDMLGINCAIGYLQAKRLRIDTKRSVYKIPKLFEEFKITDIYYGNYRIDVITLYKERNVKIPKIHSEIDIMPNFYFIVQIGAKIKEAKMIGFIDAKSVLACSSDSKYYYPSLDLIFDLKKFLALTKHSTPSRTLLGKHTDCLGLFLKFIDNDLSNVYKSQLIQHLMNCDSCRSRFIDTIEFERIANNIRFYPNLIKKHEQKIQPMPQSTVSEQSNEFEDSINRAKLEDIYQEIPEEDSEYTIIDNEEIPAKPEMTVQNLDKSEKFKINSIQSKKVIDSIFKEIRNVELPPIKTMIRSKYRHGMIAMFVVIFLFIGFALISAKNTPEISNDDMKLNQIENQYPADMGDMQDYDSYYDEYDNNNTHEARLIPKQRSIEDFNIKQPITNKPAYSPSVAKVSWEVPESLVKKPEYTKFLQLTGKNIKLNLQNDLLLVSDVPINRLITVNIKIASNGDVQAITMPQTSGSPAIDASIKRVVKDALKYTKPPAHGIIARPVSASLTIELN